MGARTVDFVYVILYFFFLVHVTIYSCRVIEVKEGQIHRAVLYK